MSGAHSLFQVLASETPKSSSPQDEVRRYCEDAAAVEQMAADCFREEAMRQRFSQTMPPSDVEGMIQLCQRCLRILLRAMAYNESVTVLDGIVVIFGSRADEFTGLLHEFNQITPLRRVSLAALLWKRLNNLGGPTS